MHENLTTRTLSVRLAKDGHPATLDDASRSFEAIGATEAPCEIYDYQRGEIVAEVLLMDGLELPKSSQVPLLDSHERWDTRSVLGSYRDMRTDADKLVGRVFFSKSPEAESPWTKAKEGHLTDFSVGYRVISSQWVPDGETANFKGRSFKGPVRVTTRWRVKELSICPIGADPGAKARSETNQIIPDLKRKKPMSDEITAAIEKERSRVIDIQTICRQAGLDAVRAQKFITDGTGLDAVRSAVMEHLMASIENGGGHGHRTPVEFIGDEADKRRAAVVDGLVLRSGVTLDKPAPGAREYRGASLVDIARECLQAAGVRVSGMGKAAIAREVLSGRAAQTSDFPEILGAAVGKILLRSYEEAPATFEMWTKAADAADFKDMHRVRLSEAPDLIEIPEKGDYKYSEFDESGETYRISKYGRLWAVTREAIINDDTNAFAAVPIAFSRAAKRLVNQMVYLVLLTNGAMSDGQNLFSAAHGNLVDIGDGAVPGITTMSAARLAMRSQTGLNGAVLNLAPKFLIVPAALETTADIVLNSVGFPEDDSHSGVYNPFRGRLQLITESFLDASGDDTGWYVAADPAAADTIEVAYLNGQRNPYLETQNGWNVDGVEFKCRHEFGVKAIDWRGLYRNHGA